MVAGKRIVLGYMDRSGMVLHGAQSYDIETRLKSMYILYSYVEPVGSLHVSHRLRNSLGILKVSKGKGAGSSQCCPESRARESSLSITNRNSALWSFWRLSGAACCSQISQNK